MAGDPRVTDEIVKIARDAYYGTDDFESERFRAAIYAVLAALSAASPPAQGGEEIRIAVAREDDGSIHIRKIDTTEDSAWKELAEWHEANHRAAILTATIPAPVVPEIAAAVEKV